jgi:hypothetical protein
MNKMAKSKKYIGEYGEYLVVDESSYRFIAISWYFPNEGEYGASLGHFRDYSKLSKDDGDGCTVIIEKAAKYYLGEDAEMYDGTYIFETVKKAKDVISVLNNALLNREQSDWPGWAIKAKLEGWNPPGGWKPGKDK